MALHKYDYTEMTPPGGLKVVSESLDTKTDTSATSAPSAPSAPNPWVPLSYSERLNALERLYPNIIDEVELFLSTKEWRNSFRVEGPILNHAATLRGLLAYRFKDYAVTGTGPGDKSYAEFTFKKLGRSSVKSETAPSL